jgi:undecaprenyl-phosphate 4-deoxy-4-formamido-L-arabinose transferase
VVDEIYEAVKRIKHDYEIILVNDNAPDKTFAAIKQLCEKDSKIIGVALSKNFGQHSAQMAGFSLSSGDLVVNIDDDGQSPVKELPKLLEKLEEGFDAVFAEYINRKQTFVKAFGSWINYWMTEILTNKPKGLKTSNFYVIRRYIITEILRYKNAYPFIGGLLFRATQNVANVKINYRQRLSGGSTYTFKKMVLMWLDGFTAFSVLPLRIASVLGSFIAVSGMLLGVYILLRRLTDINYVLAGWSSLMAVLLFIGGMIMLMLGLIGEYIGRIYISINKSPQYVIKETLNNN